MADNAEVNGGVGKCRGEGKLKNFGDARQELRVMLMKSSARAAPMCQCQAGAHTRSHTVGQTHSKEEQTKIRIEIKPI